MSSLFTDPTFGIPMPDQGSTVEPELDHRSIVKDLEELSFMNRSADIARDLVR